MAAELFGVDGGCCRRVDSDHHRLSVALFRIYNGIGLSISQSVGFPAQSCTLISAISGWGVEEEDHLIAHVLALSQQEYLQSLEQIASSSSSQSMANATATVISKDCMVEQDGVGCRLNRDSYRRPCDS